MRVSWERTIVDDGSTDRAVRMADRDRVSDVERVRIVRARRDQGTGAALRGGLAHSEGAVAAARLRTATG